MVTFRLNSAYNILDPQLKNSKKKHSISKEITTESSRYSTKFYNYENS